MIVLKFGGTSVGNADAIREVASILTDKVRSDQVVAVVSAVGGVTNKLQKAASLAEKGDTGYEIIASDLEKMHISLAKELIPVKFQSPLMGKIKFMINELDDLLRGIYLLKEASAKSCDFVLSIGERLSSTIIHHFLHTQIGEVSLLDPMEFIICSSDYGKGVVLMKQSEKQASKFKKELTKLNICPGFIAATEAGNLITLGRGGSDYSAALLANFWKADLLEIWTDVSGLMTADPRLVKNSRVIPHLSYEEALELSHFGAKVLYPPSIQPALEKQIQIVVRNTFRKEDPGTAITRSWDDSETIRGISSIPDICLLNLSGSGMVGIPNFSYRLFQALSEARINVILITQASSEHSICVGIEAADAKRAMKAINTTFEFEIDLKKVNPVEIESGMAIIALVGSNMKNQVGVSGQLFSTLARNGISVKAIAQGSSERNISLVIDQQHLGKALNSVHESFFTDEKKVINLFMIGVGNVGTALITQINKQRDYLKNQHHLVLKVVGMANSKKMVFQPSGVGLTEWKKKLDSGEKFSTDKFLSKMQEMNLRNSVFLDITGSGEVAALYEGVLNHSISVVTPNKIAATSKYAQYKKLKSTARKFKSHFLFETNVCAGLPVISTLDDLIKSGDRIHRIEAVLSGTLNFLFNNYDGTKSFSEIVKIAKEGGYTEPDPRLDLSGEDVMRKILILARESGSELEMKDVKGESFVPEKCMRIDDINKFLRSLEEQEEHFQTIYGKAVKTNSKIRYVAKFDGQNASTSLEYVNESHPFYHLDGKDNIVLFYTDRYADQPLVVKGAGAGAEVTASGIFADIMKVANANS